MKDHSYVGNVATTPDGKYAISGSLHSTLKIWEIPEGRCVSTLKGHIGYANNLAVTPDGKYVVSGVSHVKAGMEYEDKILKIWQIPTGKCVNTLKGHTGSVKTVVITPDGRFAISGSDDCTLRIWELSDGRCIKVLEGHTSSINSVSITPDTYYVVSGSENETIILWRMLWELNFEE